MARSFQKELDQIAEKADTSTPAGLSYVLTGKTKIYMLFDFTTSYYCSVINNRGVILPIPIN
jgi:uncharacterized membrane protein